MIISQVSYRTNGPLVLLLDISETVVDIFLIIYIWIHIDDIH